MNDELRKPIKWDRPCYKCGSYYCDLSCPDRAKNANAAPDELRKAAGTAVDVWDDTGTRHEDVVNAMNNLRKVLAKNANAAPEQEPDAWMADDGRLCKETTKQYLRLSMAQDFHIPLYRHPALKVESK